MKLNTKKVALTAGVVWGGAMFVTTLLSVYTGGYASAFLNGIASIYPGYSISLSGSIVGLIYGFLDASIGVYIVVWIYKKLGK
ncbi:MAG TPA: hypothetical protein VF189_06400 [Patescibacteria group bacterium]